jgi:hypothetical protein
MAKKKKSGGGFLRGIAGGGANARGKRRRSNRPRGEGRGFVDSIKALFSR